MGCTPSKQSVCRNCNSQCSPVRRSYSSYPRHSPPRKEDNHHVVALTSTTLGYLLLNQNKHDTLHTEPVRRNAPEKNSKDFAAGVIEAKTWSKLIDEKLTKMVPKTPIRTPPGEPETINAWELMEGLDDSSPFNPQLVNEKQQSDDYSGNDSKKLLQNGKKEKLVLYFTSLRGVRKTYEDCCHVRVVLKNSGFRVDERDVSMHSGFKDELKELLGDRYGGGGLPKVFVGRKYIGGVDEIRRFHDEFQLDKVFEGCEMMDDYGGGGCEACGDIRFLPCETCSGSCKIYNEVNVDECEKEVEGESDYGFQRCPDCNENGLVRCPICCD